jgi:hypothetical protein
MTKIGVHLVVNIFVTFLPLRISEPIMKAFNPSLSNRERIADYNPDDYETMDWDKVAITRKRDLLRTARLEREATGAYSIKVKKNDPSLESAALR